MNDFESMINRIAVEMQNPNNDKFYVVLGVVLAYVGTKVAVSLGGSAINKLKSRNQPTPFVSSVLKEMDETSFYVEKEKYISCKTYRVYPLDKDYVQLTCQYSTESQKQDLTCLLTKKEKKLLKASAEKNKTRILEANKEASRQVFLKRHENHHT